MEDNTCRAVILAALFRTSETRVTLVTLEFHMRLSTQTQVTDVLVSYHGFSAEADRWFLSTNTRPLTIAQQGMWVCSVRVCV